MRLTPVPRKEARKRWAEAYPPRPPEPPRPPKNVREVLDLGNLTYFHFRGRLYAVPPFAFPAAQDLLREWVRVQGLGTTLDEEAQRTYFRSMRKMARIMWKHSRPVGIPLRVLRFLRLLRNPFLEATDVELGEIAGFFWRSRMKHTGSVRALDPHQLPT